MRTRTTFSRWQAAVAGIVLALGLTVAAPAAAVGGGEDRPPIVCC